MKLFNTSKKKKKEDLKLVFEPFALQEDKKNEEEQKEEVEMPEIRNKTIEEAKKILKEYDLELEISNESEDISEKEAIIKEQIPKPGIKIKKEAKVYVDI